MQKAEEHKVEDSNVENIGSAEDKAARKAAAESEPEWKGAGEAVGLEIWRVENKRTENDTPDFGVKRWPKEQCGSFYKGDSYIIMRTYQLPDDEKILFDLHFWIGEESSQDEYGVAAYKMVELDDLLDGRPVQHRETMGHESELFMSYFPDGLMIMSGGIESGFHKVTAEEYKPRLLQIQRTGNQVKTFEIDECTVGSLNNGDCFILDAGAKIFVFHGSESDAFEKNHATSTGEKMESERGDGAERVEVDETFWEILGGSEADVSSDSTVAKPGEFTGPSLYSLDDDTQEWSKVKDGLIAPDEIKTDDVMMIDCGAEIFVMVGEEAPAKEKNDCMIKAQQ
jgi:gelsolin